MKNRMISDSSETMSNIQQQTEAEPAHPEPAKGTQGGREVPSIIYVFSPPTRTSEGKKVFHYTEDAGTSCAPIYHITAIMSFDNFKLSKETARLNFQLWQQQYNSVRESWELHTCTKYTNVTSMDRHLPEVLTSDQYHSLVGHILLQI